MNPRLMRNRGVNEVLVERMPVVATDTETFAALYERTFPRVYAYVASLLRDRSIAEDVTAQAFERAYRRSSSYRARRGSREAWLFGIARNAALDELRRRKRAASTEIPAPDAGPGPEEAAELAAQRDAVRRALGRLGARDREVIALKYHADLSNAELAAVLGVSVSNAGTLVHRAMNKLREVFDA